MLFAFAATKNEVLDSGLSVTVPAIRTSYLLKSCSATILAAISSSYFSVLSNSVSCTVETATVGEINCTMFLLLGEILLMNLSI